MPFTPFIGTPPPASAMAGLRFWTRGFLWTAGALTLVTVTKLAFWDYIGPGTPFLLYFAVAAVGAWFAGWRGGLLATVASALLGAYFFLPPYHALAIREGVSAVRLAAFVFENLVVTMLTATLRAERLRANATRAQLEGVLRGVTDGITVQTRSGKLVFVNEAAARLAGFSSAAEMKAADAKDIMARFELRERDGQPLDAATLPGRLALQGLPAPERLVRFRVRATAVEHFALVRSTAVRMADLDGTTDLVAVNVFQDVTQKIAHDEALRVSEEWFSTTLRSIGDALIATDAAGAVKFVNPVAARLTGWTSADAKGRPLAEVFRIVNESSRQTVESPVERVLREGKVVGLANHTVLLGRSGTEVPIDDSAAPIRAADGPIVGTVLIFRDISERRADERRRAFIARATTELAASLEYERTLVMVVRLAVPAIADWCAIDLLEAGRLRRLAVQHVDPDKIDLVYEIDQRYPPDPVSDGGAYEVIRTGKPIFVPEIPEGMLAAAARDVEHLGLIKRLQLRSFIAVPLAINGETIGVITLAMAESRRVYGQRDLEDALVLADRAAVAVNHARLFYDAVNARREAERANRTKDEFLAILGHELRNPLAPILTALQLMKRKAPTIHDREQAILERQIRHVTRLIDDLLDVSRITSGKIELAKEEVDLLGTVGRALESSGPLLEENRHDVVTDLPAGLAVQGDPERLVQVFTNLISNAAKYTPRGGRIEIVGRREGDFVVLRVADNGLGLDPDILPNVFGLFVQGAQAIDRAKGGLGLGLAIVRSVVELHGGRVSAESPGLGQGSTFTVVLPAAAPGGRETGAPATVSSPSDGGVTVLVVDDNEDALDLLADALRLMGHEPVTALDPMSALERAAATKPTIGLIDIGLPGMDGYELAGRLRELPGLGQVKLVALTGYGQESDKQRARAAGFDEHLLKPVSLEQVEEVIAKLAKNSAVGSPSAAVARSPLTKSDSDGPT